MPIDHNTIATLKEKLQHEQQELEKLLSAFAKKDPNMKGNWNAQFPNMGEKSSFSSGALEERQDEIEEYEAELSEEHTLESRLKEVNAALDRIEKNAYGMCATCGKEIPLERLEANPAALCDIEHSE